MKTGTLQYKWRWIARGHLSLVVDDSPAIFVYKRDWGHRRWDCFLYKQALPFLTGAGLREAKQRALRLLGFGLAPDYILEEGK